MAGLKRKLIGLTALTTLSGAIIWACAGGPETPEWTIAKVSYDPYGSGAALVPGNDTRTNMLLLMADRRGSNVRDVAAKQAGPPLILAPWKVIAAQAVPPAADSEESYSDWEPTRCQSNADGTEAFVTALGQAKLSATERDALTAARRGLQPNCNAAMSVNIPTAASPVGQAYAAYLAGAAAFYSGDWKAAGSRFASLGDAPDGWVRETSTYMVGRTALNAAIATSVDDYGYLKEAKDRDLAPVRAAGQGFLAYLGRYPQGRYASSARGLLRRVAWLEGDNKVLADLLAEQLGRKTYDGAARDIDLIEEIDDKLLESGAPVVADQAILTAVSDLRRMRPVEEWEQGRTRLTQEELQAQRPIFARDPALFDYLRAAHALFVRNQPREALALIPDAAHQQRFTYVQFSRQMLRGMALDAVGDRNTRGFWLSLLPGATQPYQRGAVELALGLHDERAGQVDRLLAADSPFTHPLLRQLLLERTAGPDLLRRQATANVPAQERSVALYMLLARQLRGGAYRQWLADAKLVPASAPTESGYWSAAYYSPAWRSELEPPPVGLFGKAAKLGDFGCPALAATVGALAAQPQAIRPRLCLAEFFRQNGFDGFEQEYGPLEGGGLASSKPQHAFPAYVRQTVYQQVLASPAASPDDKALALNRLVRCYAPSGYNSCGGDEAGKPQRKAWFDRLKRDYPASRWAKDLKYYW